MIVRAELSTMSGCIVFRHICMCVVNKQFELIELVFDSVCVYLQYDEIYLTLLLGMRACVVTVVM